MRQLQEESEDLDEEDAEEDILLTMGEDGVLHKYVPKPQLILEFESEDELKQAMELIKNSGIIKKDGVMLVHNISLEFINSYKETPASEDEEDEYSNN